MNVSRFIKASAMVCLSLSLTATTMTGCTDNKATEEINTDGSDPLFQQKNISNFDITNTKKIVLTFDDGPSPEATPVLLDILRIYNIKATFFVLAQNAKKYPEIMRRMKEDGHIIANHSYSHANLSSHLYSQYNDMLLREVVESDKVISKYMSDAFPRYFRAPYGAWTATHADKLNRIASVRDYIGPVFWSVGGSLIPNVTVNYKTGAVTGSRPKTAAEITSAADWDCWSSSKKFNYSALPVEVCLAGYLKETRRKGGGVVLMHDLSLNTVDMTAQFIPTLLKEGYSFVNLNELRSLDQYK